MTTSSDAMIPEGFAALTPSTLPRYMAAHSDLVARLGGTPAQWHVREVGDGNLNLVFVVEGATATVCVKQALPYVRLVGESWPLPVTRSHFEYAALRSQSAHASQYVPAVYFHDPVMALTVMEYLSPHIILRKGLVAGIRYPLVAAQLGEYLALTLFHSSDLYQAADAKRRDIALFAGNSAMCKITEDLIFDEPFFNASMNRHTEGLAAMALEFRRDSALKSSAQEMKWGFLNHAEALLHGDLHTGSVMVTQSATHVIDPEFAFYGPMGFDLGMLIANFILAYFAQPGLAETSGSREAFATWIAQQIVVFWNGFSKNFSRLWRGRDSALSRGSINKPCIGLTDASGLTERLSIIWNDALGFAGLEIIRRILGLAHVDDFESIPDLDVRAACEAQALSFARTLLKNPRGYGSAGAVCSALLQRNGYTDF